jgi:integrase
MNKFTDYLKLNIDSSQTINLYLIWVKNYFKTYDVFNQENVNSYLTKLVDENKKYSFNTARASLKKYSLFTKIAIEFPKQKNITRKNILSLSVEEITEEIIPYFPHLFKDYHKRITILRFMMLTLMRISEIVNLKKEDIDFDTGSIWIKHAKGDKHRKTFLHPTIKADVMKVVEESKTEYAFNITQSYIRYMFTKINNELNYKQHITPHTTRRAGGKFLRKQGIKLEDLQKMFGHESLRTTGLYLISDIEEIHEAYNKIKYNKG